MLKSLNVLYAENEDIIRENVVEALEFMSMKVTSVTNGEEAYKEYLKNKPDIIILDIEIPICNGLELAEKIRIKDKDTQIIIATKSTNLEYLLKAVELNLVKYLLKPVSLNDLKSTLTICIDNLKYKSERINKYFNDNDYYNLSEQCLFVNKKIVRLDNHERDFLELLLRNHKRIVFYSEIEKQIWKNKMSSAAIRSLVRNLRKKLPDNVIENVSKTGYKVIIKN
ncbi:response regulator transcription factor [Arcobacter sp. LA11]|uniref:response regulator transcription factor n=1 Tax=Arcobacter sp. LA11 TaxID=1898176 RepID=UPI00093494FB|nr:response regulator [Arcobacter sp. LA11]